MDHKAHENIPKPKTQKNTNKTKKKKKRNRGKNGRQKHRNRNNHRHGKARACSHSLSRRTHFSWFRLISAHQLQHSDQFGHYYNSELGILILYALPLIKPIELRRLYIFIIYLSIYIYIEDGRTKAVQDETMRTLSERTLSSPDLPLCPRRCRAPSLLCWFLQR